MDKKKVAFLSIGHLSCDINAGALPAVFPFLRDSLGLTYQATGGIMFAYSLISAIFQPLFGLMVDRFTRPWLIPLGVLLAGLGLACAGIVSTYHGVLLAIAVSGVGTALFHPPAARLANKVAGARKSFTLSLFSIGGNAGFVLGPMLASLMLALFHLKGTLFFGALAVGMAIALTLCLARPGETEMQADAGGKKVRVERPHDNNWSQFGRLTVAIVTRTVVFSCLTTYLPLYWVQAFHQPAAAGALAVTVVGAFGVVSNVCGGLLADRWGQGPILRLAFVPMAPVLFAFSLTESVWLAWPLVALMGFTLYFAFSSMVVLGQQFLARNIGFASGVTLGLSTAMGGLCAPIIGWIGDHWGLATSFQVLAGLALLAAITTFFIDPRVNAERIVVEHEGETPAADRPRPEDGDPAGHDTENASRR